ncbi:unnamed protein product [Rotaria sp. Silwood1]|nr:unnamed protein product [Rotaria sp. Silwood1]
MRKEIMHSSVPLLEFDKQGDVRLIQSKDNKSLLHCQCLFVRYILHQINVERKEIISETYGNIRSLAIHLLNEQLNENFENAYQQWRWDNEKLLNYIYLNSERAKILDNQTEFELENLLLRLEVIR